MQGFQEGNPILIRVKDPIGNELASLISGEFGDDYGVEKRADSSNYLPRFRTEPYATVTLDLNQGVLPSEFSVENAYPNPFNSTTTVPFELPKSGEVSYTLYNLLGQKVLEQSRQYNAGLNQLVIDIGKSDYGTSSGLYLLSVRYNRTTLSQKIILLK